MASFSRDTLDRIISQVDIVELISRDVALKRSGSNLLGLCPFHNEKTPSFSVSSDKQLFYCFGCGKGGNAFQFVMEHDGLPFPEAVESLAARAGVELPKRGPDSGDDAYYQSGLELLERAASAFQEQLTAQQGATARAYLEGRGLPEAMWKAYSIGYAPPGYGFMRRYFGADTKVLRLLDAAGLVFQGKQGPGDRFRARVVFPIKNQRGQVVGFGGRVMGDGEPKYLNSPETKFFHKSDLLYGLSEHRSEIRSRGQLVIVEGYMDVLALAAHDLPIAVAPLGTAMNAGQIRRIFQLCPAPVFCFDGDRAGRRAAWRALEQMLPGLAAEHEPRFLFLPEGEDPDSLVSRQGRQGFIDAMESARPVLDTLLAGLHNLAGSGVEAGARVAKKADAMLARMKDDYLRQAWRQVIERDTGISLSQARRPAVAAEQSGKQQASSLDERFLAALLQKPQRLRSLPAEAREITLDDEGVHAIYTRAFSYAEAGDSLDERMISRLAMDFPDEQRLARWACTVKINDDEFAGFLPALQARDIKRRGITAGDLAHRVALKRQLMKTNQQRRGANAHD
ncbi:MAG: DNA primase [Mariprofundaceae bacterium]